MASIYDTISGWSNSVTYIKYNIVSGADLRYYYSLTNANSTNNPTSISNLQNSWDGYININSTLVPSFFWKPSYTSNIAFEPNIINIQFGNGYQQRIPNGINFDLLKFEATFENRMEMEAVSMLHFLDQRGGAQAFIYNVPTIYSKSNFNTKFIAPNWNVTYNSYNNYTIKVRIEEVAA